MDRSHLRGLWPLALLFACGDDAPADTTTTTMVPSTVTLTPTTGGDTTADVPTEPDPSTTTQTASSTGGGPCTSSLECGEGNVCAGGACIPGEGGCSGDDDCTGDTYCCDMDCLPPGETAGVCVPFGTPPKGDTNDECVGDVAIGLFEPSVQCEWLGPPDGDPYPDHKNVLTTPLIFDLPNDSGVAAEMVIVAYNYSDGGSESGVGDNPSYYGVIRVLDGTTCAQHETIDDPANRVIAASPPAIADLDGDGLPEIVTHRAVTGLVAFGWDGAKFATKWVALDTGVTNTTRWDGPSIHDLDGDGIGEVISASGVFDGATGIRLNPGQVIPGVEPNGIGRIPVLGDLDADGTIDMVAGDIYSWDVGTNTWVMKYTGIPGTSHYGFADFGTPGPDAASFNPTALDGIAEVVTVDGGTTTHLYTLSGQELFTVPLGGGPPTIGDFDNDGFPEIASAGATLYTVFDLDCKDPMAPGCAGPYVRWSQASQDMSSRNTGSSIFDFEGDGAAEAIYADECFLRVYQGSTGEVLYSAFRTSCTWFENPVVGDPDNDQNTEILVGSNSNCNVVCPTVDPIHRGEICETGEQCAPPGICDAGFCRCNDDTQCLAGDSCQPPILNTPGNGQNVCRAVHPPGVGLTGLRVLRDALDRWASSRPMWNQHAYSITNIDDDGGLPSPWQQNFTTPGLNNYRQNRQGDVTAADLPDITGELDPQSCMGGGGKVILTSSVCNRGKKSVGANLPATFYLGDPADGVVLCVAYTAEPVPIGECRDVSCELDDSVDGTVTVVVDDDGQGGQAALECFENNNTDTILIQDCNPVG